jgi:hypothetical protein
MKCEICDVRLRAVDGGRRVCQSCHKENSGNGPALPACVDCGKPTISETLVGVPMCPKCFDAREEAAWMKTAGVEAAR